MSFSSRWLDVLLPFSFSFIFFRFPPYFITDLSLFYHFLLFGLNSLIGSAANESRQSWREFHPKFHYFRAPHGFLFIFLFFTIYLRKEEKIRQTLHACPKVCFATIIKKKKKKKKKKNTQVIKIKKEKKKT